ncbi:MAG: T9SS type A sorting domain-containing protein [Tannerella sp.]|jgi:hypothetical protein|nr:T9SS type A sorting domain-containing protein [Tannerella sp.]
MEITNSSSRGEGFKFRFPYYWESGTDYDMDDAYIEVSINGGTYIKLCTLDGLTGTSDGRRYTVTPSLSWGEFNAEPAGGNWWFNTETTCVGGQDSEHSDDWVASLYWYPKSPGLKLQFRIHLEDSGTGNDNGVYNHEWDPYTTSSDMHQMSIKNTSYWNGDNGNFYFLGNIPGYNGAAGHDNGYVSNTFDRGGGQSGTQLAYVYEGSVDAYTYVVNYNTSTPTLTMNKPAASYLDVSHTFTVGTGIARAYSSNLYKYQDGAYTLPAYPQPTGLSVAHNDAAKTITLSWKMAAGSDKSPTDGYKVEYKAGGSWVSLTSPTSGNLNYSYSETTHTVTFAMPENAYNGNYHGTYTFRVYRAHWNSNNVYYSESAGNILYNSFNSATAHATGSGDVEVDWQFPSLDAQPAGSEIRIYRRSSAEASYSEIPIYKVKTSASTPTKWLNTGIDGCVTYYYRIALYNRAYADGGNNSDGCVASIDVTPVGDDGQPTGQAYIIKSPKGSTQVFSFTASKGYYNDQVELKWSVDPNTIFTSYQIVRQQMGAGAAGLSTITTVQQTTGIGDYSYVDKNMQVGVYYTYTLHGLLNCGGVTTDQTGDTYQSVGYAMPLAVVTGKVTFSGGTAVQGVSILVKAADNNGSSLFANKSLEFDGQTYIKTPGLQAKAFSTTGDFSFQTYVNRDGEAGDLFNAPGRYRVSLDADGHVLFSIYGSEDNGKLASFSDYTLPAHEWHQLTITYNNTTGVALLYVDDSQTPYSVTLTPDPSGFSNAMAQNDTLYIGAQGDDGKGALTGKNVFKGYMDELRLWQKVLTPTDVANTYDRYLSGQEDGLSLYYRFDEAEGIAQVFDQSGQNGLHNEMHGDIIHPTAEIRSTTEIPTSQQLAIKGVTDANGSYSINTIPYSSQGTTYIFTPSMGVHQFNPSSQNIFLGPSKQTAEQDFTDVSSFTVSGKVIYDGGNYPVEGAGFKIDDAVQMQGGNPVVTDADGQFSISVPIGVHKVQVYKSGHLFVDDGYLVDETTGQELNYNADISNLIFRDTTRVKLIGYIVGGDREKNKDDGYGERVNNIGADVLTLTAANPQYLLRAKSATSAEAAELDTFYKHPTAQGVWINPNTDEDSNRVATIGSTVTIHVSKKTGEYVAWLRPVAYTVGDITVNANITGHDMVIYNKKEALDLRDAPVADARALKTSVKNWTDSTWVTASGNVAAHWNYFDETDTVKYNAEWAYEYQAQPSFTITQSGTTGYFGDKDYTLADGKTVVPLVNNPGEANQSYTFKYPVFSQSQPYTFLLQAFEEYQNLLDGSPLKGKPDLVPVSGGTVNITNQFATNTKEQQIALDDNGIGTYSFMGGAPDLTTGLEKLDATLTVGSLSYYPTNFTESNGVLTAYLLGGVSTGTDFMTAAPDRVDYVLHDPPGSLSSAYITKGSTYSTTTTTELSNGLHQEADVSALLGINTITLAGVGVLAGGENEIENTVGASDETESSWVNDTTITSSTTLTETLNTSNDPAYVGQEGDVYVGRGTNILYGLANTLKIQRTGDFTGGSTPIVTAGNYSLGVATDYAIGLSNGTRFYYTQSDIENIMIPKWQNALDNIFVFTAPTGTVTQPVYVSHLNKDDPNFGKPNPLSPNPPTFDADKNKLEGDYYDIYFPPGQVAKMTEAMTAGNSAQYGTIQFTDTVSYYNDKINQWKQLMADNEKNQVDATYGNNISITAGASPDISKTIDYTKVTTTGQNVSTQVLANTETGFKLFGVGIHISASMGWTHETNKTTDIENTTETTVGFTAQASDSRDNLSVSYGFDPMYGTYVFHTTGGRTSCPYEDAYVTKYYEPGAHTLAAATMRLDAPRISTDGATKLDVPSTRDASFNLTLSDESDVQGSTGLFRIAVDPASNPDGAVVKYNGASLTGEGTQLSITQGTPVKGVITIGKGPNATEYKNIRIVMAAACDFDLTGMNEGSYAETFLSANFLPSCSEAYVASPKANWVINTATGTKMAVQINGFDINYKDFDHIELQYRKSGSPDWSTVHYFYGDKTRMDAASLNADMASLISGGTINYTWDMSQILDGAYELRAYSECKNGATIVSTFYSDGVPGYKDMQKPEALGNPSPVNGILSTGGEISVTFNEPIQSSLLTTNNFSIRGIENASILADPVVGMNFDGTGRAYTELPIYADGSFSIEGWFRPEAGKEGTLFSYGSGDNYLSLALTADAHLTATFGTEKFTSDKTIGTDGTWQYIALAYDREANSFNVYDFSGTTSQTLFNTPPSPVQTPTTDGKLTVGNVAIGNSDGFHGAVARLHFYSTAHSQDDVKAEMNLSLSGTEANLVGYWPMDEGEGTVAADKARQRDLTMQTSWYIFPSGDALALSGSDYATIDTSGFAFPTYDNFTIELHFKGATQQNDTLMALGNDLSLVFDASGALVLSTPNGTQTLTQTNLLDEQWHYLALSVKRSGKTNAYVDGKLLTQIDNTVANPLIGAISTDTYYLGSGPGHQSGFFTGLIDEVRVWSAALSSDIINDNKNVKMSGTEAGLVAYYPFEEYVTQGNNLTVSEPSTTDQVSEALAKEQESEGKKSNTPRRMGGTATLSSDGAPMQDVRPLTGIPFTFTASDTYNKVVLNLTEAAYKIEGTTLYIEATGFKDVHNNEGDPISWVAYVNENTLKWETSSINLQIEEGQTGSFTATFKNSGAANADYYIEDVPDWLTLSESSMGTLSPLGEQTLHFSVPAGVNVGSYEVAIVLRGTNNIREVLPVTLKVTGKKPDGWTVNTDDYEAPMGMTGQLMIDGAYQEDPDDELAAFIDGKCRGTASPVYSKAYNAYFVYLNVWGNDEDKGKAVTFKIWDASTGNIYSDVNLLGYDGTMSYDHEAIRGTVTNPIVFNALDVIEQTLSLRKGWNWISSYVAYDQPSLLEQLQQKGGANLDQIKARGGFSYPTAGVWSGSLTAMDNSQMYMVHTTAATSLTLNGKPVNPLATTLTLKPKWNWISYTPQFNLPVANALAGVKASNLDQIKGRAGFATYTSAGGWQGSLESMVAGQGYMYYSYDGTAKTFYYPATSSIAGAGAATRASLLRSAEPLHWSADKASDYASTMTVAADVYLDGQLQVGQQIEVGAFVGNECRGTALLKGVEGYASPYVAFLTVFGNEDEKDKLSFRIYDHAADKEYPAAETLNFRADSIVGTPEQLFRLNGGATTGTEGLEAGIRFYPNPVVHELYLEYAAAALDCVEIHDAQGKLMFRQQHFTAKGIDLSNYTPGVYFLMITHDGQTSIYKVMKK